MNMKLALLVVILVSQIMTLVMPACQAQVSSNKPPKLACDNIRGHLVSYMLDIAEGLGFEIREITGNTIIESDLADIDILLLYVPLTPYFTQTEINLMLDFLKRGEALYIVPYAAYHGGWNTEWIEIDTYYNVLYSLFGFKISGTDSDLEYPDIKNVTFTHPIMDGVSHITLNSFAVDFVANLDLLTNPAQAILYSEGKPFFWFQTTEKARYL